MPERGHLIGVAFRAEPHPDFPLARRKATHCAFMGRARAGEAVQVDMDRLSCPLARYNLGMPSPSTKGMARALRVFGGPRTADGGMKYLGSAVRPGSLGPYVLYFPHPTEGLDPQVLVWVGSAGEMSRLVHEHTRRTGERLEASISGLGAACGECTSYPLLTGKVNVSLGCKGCRPAMDMDESELLLAAPAGTAMFDLLAEKAS